MRILVLSTRIPFPLVDGFRIRVYNLAKYCKNHGYHVDLLYIGKKDVYQQYKCALHEVFDSVFVVGLSAVEILLNLFKCAFAPSTPLQVALYKNRKMQSELDAICAQYDIVLANHIRTTEYLHSVDSDKTIVDMHDALSLNYENAIRHLRGIKRLVYRIEKSRVSRYEQLVVQTFRRIVITSERDKKWLGRSGVDTSNIRVIPVAVRDDITQRKISYTSDKNTICFLGQMSYQPNVDAVRWFSTAIFPQLRHFVPDLQFVIMGTNPTKEVRKLTCIPGVSVTGFVDDPYAVIAQSKAVVAPIRNGAGVQNKVLESMLIGTPTVISPLVSEGIGGNGGEDYVVAETAEDYIGAILRLIRSQQLREKYGTNGRKYVLKNYMWDRLWAQWDMILRDEH